jgi:signal peptidase II
MSKRSDQSPSCEPAEHPDSRRRHAYRIILVLSILVITVSTDQITKIIARAELPGRGTIEVAGTFLVITYAENLGAFLGLGSNWPPALRALVFGVVSGIVVVLAVVYLIAHRGLRLVETIAFSLIAGGGVGNMIDRITRGGAVSDFLNIGIGRLRTGVFNLADLYLMIGIFLFIVASFTTAAHHEEPSR